MVLAKMARAKPSEYLWNANMKNFLFRFASHIKSLLKFRGHLIHNDRHPIGLSIKK